MTAIEEVRSRLNEMKSHYKSGFSSIEQEYMDELHLLIFNKPLQKRMGCQDCYRDAFILLSNKVQSLTEMPVHSNYKLKAGVVASTFGSSDFYVLEMPDEAAEKWLFQYPDRINLFQKYPSDWQSRIAAKFAPESIINTEDEQLPISEDKIESAQKKGRKKANK